MADVVPLSRQGTKEKAPTGTLSKEDVRVHVEAVQPQEPSLIKSICITLTCFSATTINSIALTSVSIGLPTIGRELNIEQSRLQWVVSAFALSSGCFLLLFGRLADLHGRKLVFLVGSAWVSIFSLGGGFSQSEVQINVLRGMQGVGSAATIPAALGILAHSFPPGPRRSVAFATFSAGSPFGAGIGFILGGVITQLASVTWRGNFFLAAGLSALAVIAGIFAIDRDGPSTEPDRRVDWIGAALVTIGLVFIMFVLGQGELASNGWKTPYIIALLIVGVFLVVAFVFWEHFLVTRTTRPPLMRLDMWGRANGKFAAMQCIAFLEWCAFMSFILWAQLYYQTYRQFSPIKTSLQLLPMVITGLTLNFVVSIVVGILDVIWLLGTLATGGACILFALIKPSVTFWAFGFPAAILAVGGADFIFACGTIFVARVALPHEQSVAGGLFQTLTQLGTAFGLAITTIVNDRVMRQESLRAGVVLDSDANNAPQEAILKGYRAAQWTSFAFAMAALLLAILFLRGVGIIGGKHADPHQGTVDSEPMEEASKTEESPQAAVAEP